jgi:hypothetical protein
LSIHCLIWHNPYHNGGSDCSDITLEAMQTLNCSVNKIQLIDQSQEIHMIIDCCQEANSGAHRDDVDTKFMHSNMRTTQCDLLISNRHAVGAQNPKSAVFTA